MGVLSREQLTELSKKPAKVKLVDVPEFGEAAQVYIRMMTGTELNAYQKSLAIIKPGQTSATPDLADSFAKLAVRTLSDDMGNRLYTDADVAAAGKLPADGLKVVFEESAVFNKIKKGAVEEEVKNSASTQTT